MPSSSPHHPPLLIPTALLLGLIIVFQFVFLFKLGRVHLQKRPRVSDVITLSARVIPDMIIMSDSRSPLLRLPDELLLAVLGHLPLEAILSIQSTCKSINRLIEDGYSPWWRNLCLSMYRYWASDHDIDNLIKKPAGLTNWKSLLARRKRTDRLVTGNLESILESQASRIVRSLKLVEQGFDAKDALLRHIKCPDDAPDVLARRYHAKDVLGSINRKLALEEWQKLLNGSDIPLERALGVFDQFVAETPPLSLDGISERLDYYANEFKKAHSGHATMTTREKALQLAAFLRSKGFTGVRTPEEYHRLYNNLIGVALCEGDHSALPLITAAIYSCIAKRLDINAQPCNFPFHILVTVTSDPDIDLNGQSLVQQVDSRQRVMYLDPFRAALEVNPEFLLEQMEIMNATESHKASWMSPATNMELINRTWRNVIQALQESHDYSTVLLEPAEDLKNLDVQPSILNPHRALYAVKWANMFFGNFTDVPHGAQQALRTRPLAGIVSDMQARFKLDIHLVKSHIFPLFPFGEQRDYLEDMYQRILQEDSIPPEPQRRCEHDHQRGQDHEGFDGPPKCVKYKIGQLFRHKRYGYLAAITGWDTSCRASDGWISQMRVDALPNGRDQSFYHVMVDDESSRYVAEENVEPLGQGVAMLRRTSAGFMVVEDGDASNEGPNEALMRQAGKHFKRWEQVSMCFVSNMRDQYPDD